LGGRRRGNRAHKKHLKPLLRTWLFLTYVAKGHRSNGILVNGEYNSTIWGSVSAANLLPNVTGMFIPRNSRILLIGLIEVCYP
jgi:hypothetical protein